MSRPFLVVCSIGNPGSTYEYTRHSAGHIVNNKIQEYLEFTAWRRNSQLRNCVIATHPDYPILLYKSLTMMNMSGGPIARNWRLLKREKENQGYQPYLVILHDELALAVGMAKIRAKNSSPRGHNGLKSIRSVLGGTYLSIAVGIDRPENMDIGDYVLSRFSNDDLRTIQNETAVLVCELLEEMIDGNHLD